MQYVLRHSTTTMTEQHVHTRLKQTCGFMADYATAMLSAGATNSRIDRCVRRIAGGCGVDVDLSILPTRVLLAVWDKEHSHSYSQVGRTQTGGVNLNTVSRLSRLSHAVADDRLSVGEARAAMEQIVREPRIGKWLVIVLTSIANLSFCELFGGDWLAMSVVFVATFAGYSLKEALLSWRWDTRIVTIVSSTVSAILGASCLLFGIGETPEVALATSVLWLVPGIRFINAMSDLLKGHHLCAASRLTDALVTTICLSLGLCIALLLVNIEWK